MRNFVLYKERKSVRERINDGKMKHFICYTYLI